MFRRRHPDAQIVCYINSTAEVKAECDVCCTSANARKVVENLPADKVLLLPDQNLAHYVQRFTDKKVIPWNGYCYVHRKIREKEVARARRLYPEALLVVHPECDPEVVELADEATGTGGMVRLAKESAAQVFLVGTEEGLIRRLRRENPGKVFFSAGRAQSCSNMKRTTLKELYRALLHEPYKVELPEEVARRARLSLEAMFSYA